MADMPYMKLDLLPGPLTGKWKACAIFRALKCGQITEGDAEIITR